MNEHELSLTAPDTKRDVQRGTPTAADILQGVLAVGITQENVAAVREIVLLMREEKLLDAKQQFARAFNALQSEMPKIQAKSVVPNNDGGVRYKFAAYEDIMEQVRPYLDRHGFTVSFNQRYSDGQPQRLISVCTLRHVSGHEQSNDFAVRIGSGPPKATETQADGAAATYAKRFALCNALNIVIEKDSDARAEGAPITPEQANDLQKRVKEAGMDSVTFLKFASAKTFEEIPEGSYQAALDLLASKPTSEKKKLSADLWAKMKLVRGSLNNWETAEAWLQSKRITEPNEKVAPMTVERLREVLDKVESALEP